jgi:hypothetical protein
MTAHCSTSTVPANGRTPAISSERESGFPTLTGAAPGPRPVTRCAGNLGDLSRRLDHPPGQLITGWAGQSCRATAPGDAPRGPRATRAAGHRIVRRRERVRWGDNPDVQTSQRDGLPHVDPGFRGEPFGPCYVSRGPLHMAQPVADSGRISGASTRGPNPVRRERTMPLAGPTRTNGEARAGLGPRPRRPSRGGGGLAHAAGWIASFR